ncbi:hypothetical protein CUMW_288890 [Citrus unshiu]|uniref:Uncharacterized protein n=1 Tax=Citrus unshiu TaxID=55188 RepID=A0A2H5QY99_CITUN|nr:hypothetical protein CUMW_288890 [Citrus unshiu]
MKVRVPNLLSGY